ncbi:hypothetical protein Pmani_023484 [Petrolisthes manimaculis]|uniref:Uncharacterized protein n=1 Tax=Petrolisthes manimaculis TaxID=1843537 RepID=A0AAE1PB20_9EUCA|nr:hypothetical protein Pmani_023484 [Petrolisthes manimaculis]
MRTRNNPGPDAHCPGPGLLTEATSSTSEHEAANTAHQNDNNISLKTSIVTNAITLINENTATIIKLGMNEHDMNGWTEVKSKSSKKKEHQVKNIQEQENSAHTSQFTKLLITPTQHFKTAYNVVDALEKKHPTLKFQLKMTPAGNVLITPPDAHTFHLLKNITKQAKCSPHATEVCLKKLKEQQPTTAKWITKHGTGIVQLEELWYKLGRRNKQHGSSQTSQHLPQQNNKT